MLNKLLTHRANRLASTLKHVDFDALFDTLAHTLAELQVKKPADKVCDVKVFALVDMLAYILEEKNAKKLAANHGQM